MIKKISTKTLWANTFRWCGQTYANFYETEAEAVYQHKYRLRSIEEGASKVIRITRRLKNSPGTLPQGTASLSVWKDSESRFHYAESEGESTTTSTVYQSKVSLPFFVAEPTDFLISWTCEVKAYAGSVQLRVQHKDNFAAAPVLAAHRGENCGWNMVGGFKMLTLMPGSHIFDLGFRSICTGSAGIQRARLKVVQI